MITKEDLKNARVSSGLTQRKMSELLGIPKRTIEDWETGKRNPKNDYVWKGIIEKLNQIKKGE